MPPVERGVSKRCLMELLCIWYGLLNAMRTLIAVGALVRGPHVNGVQYARDPQVPEIWGLSFTVKHMSDCRHDLQTRYADGGYTASGVQL